MKLVVDASVFLAFVIPEEKEHGESARFFACCETGNHQILFPALALAEVAGGVARRKRDPEKAALAVSRMRRFAGASIFLLTEESAMAAAKLAANHFLRGADAVYCQLARENRVPLITFDMEILKRAPGVMRALSPQAWIDSRRT